MLMLNIVRQTPLLVKQVPPGNSMARSNSMTGFRYFVNVVQGFVVCEEQLLETCGRRDQEETIRERDVLVVNWM